MSPCPPFPCTVLLYITLHASSLWWWRFMSMSWATHFTVSSLINFRGLCTQLSLKYKCDSSFWAKLHLRMDGIRTSFLEPFGPGRVEGESLGSEQDSRTWEAPLPTVEFLSLSHFHSLLIFPRAWNRKSLKSLRVPLSAKRSWPHLEAIASSAHSSSPFFLHLLSPPHCSPPLLLADLFIHSFQTSYINWASTMNWALGGVFTAPPLLLLLLPFRRKTGSNATHLNTQWHVLSAQCRHRHNTGHTEEKATNSDQEGLRCLHSGGGIWVKPGRGSRVLTNGQFW